ncbi:helix-turn-helix domain-containing protein [Sporolactobacillus inulinus]|nr:helix-turn-helix domain-containing protein [Sporolactobacillus inulinus]
MTLKGLKVRIYPNEKQKVMIHLNFGYNRVEHADRAL